MKQEYEALFAPHFNNATCPEIPGEKPLVSVLCAYYNNAAYLEDFLNSLLAQTYENWELLFVDDASPDTEQALAILKRFPDTRIRYQRLEHNSGAAVARNSAFRLSRGDYVLYFDPDDIMHPWFLQTLMARALSPAEPDIVMMDLLLFGPVTGRWSYSIFTEKDLTLRDWIPGPSLTRRKLWEATGGQNPSEEIRLGNQDWEFWLHCAEKCGPLAIAHVPLPLMLYRQHGQSSSSKRNCNDHRIHSRILADHPDIFRRHGTGQEFLALGYCNSMAAHLSARRFKEALVILREARSKLPLRHLAASLSAILWAQAASRPLRLWFKCRHLGRKYVLDPLGLLPKRNA